MCDPEKVFVAVKHTDASKGLIWLPPLDFNNTYTLLMQKQRAVELGIHAISDLGKYVNKYPDSLIFGMNPEFWERPDGFKSLMKTYGFRVPVKKIKKMATGICYTALKEEKTDVSMGFSTDGRVTAFGFVSLMDDKNFFPVYHPAPVVRKEVLDRYPEIKDILKPMTLINTKKMRSLNAAVDIEKKSAEKVAIKWAKEKEIWK
jgi:osmoprotectant transport system substrate-binding protein